MPESAEASAGGNFVPEPGDVGAFEEPLTDPVAAVESEPMAPRRFRSWAAAEEQKPSFFSRLAQSIGGMFRRKRDVAPAHVELPEEESPDVAAWSAENDVAAARYEGDASPDDRPWMEPRVVEDEPLADEPTDQPARGFESRAADLPWIDPPQASATPSELEAEPASDADAVREFLQESPPPVEVPEAEPRWDSHALDPAPSAEAPGSEPVPATAPAADESRFSGPFFEAPTEIIEEPEPPKRGFFARLFGRKPRPIEQRPPLVEAPLVSTNEYAAEPEPSHEPDAAVARFEYTPEPEQPFDAGVASAGVLPEEGVPSAEQESAIEARSEIEAAFDDAERSFEASTAPSYDAAADDIPVEPAAETFATVDDALPAAVEPPVETFDALSAPEREPEPAVEEPEPGFFARLLGRKSRKSVKKVRPSLEIEIHEDRIAAAADALDQIHAQPFAEAQPDAPATEPFSSVEAALPEPASDERFAPPPAFVEPEPAQPAAFTPPDSRPTVETERESRPTVEVTKDARPTMEIAPSAPDLGKTMDAGFDFGKTMDAGFDFGKTMDAGIDLGKTMDAGIDLGKTMDAGVDDDTLEVTKGKAPKAPDIHLMFGNTIEIAEERRKEADSGAYFGDTLEPSHFGDIAPPPDVIDKDTDEFAVPIVKSEETPSVAMPDADEDTAQVSRKSLIQKLLFWRKEQEAAAAPVADGSQTVVEGNPNFLFSKFRTFYNEIIRHKHQKSEFTAGFSTAIVTDYTADLSPEGAADALSKNLAAMLELQAAEATWMGGESAQRYPDAQYAMAALADETFLHQEWEGKGAWHRHLLEVKLFRSRSADVELFKRIDKLLKDQPNSAAARDLARVYLMVIAAGFKGKYRPFGLTRALADYRQRLYEYIHHGGDALMLYAPERRIFPEAMERTLVGHAIGRFTSAQRWAAILAFLLLSYTAIAHYAWSRVSADLKDVTDRIKATSTTASGNGGP